MRYECTVEFSKMCEDELGVMKSAETVCGEMCIPGTTIFCWCYSSFNLETSHTIAGEVLQPQ